MAKVAVDTAAPVFASTVIFTDASAAIIYASSTYLDTAVTVAAAASSSTVAATVISAAIFALSPTLQPPQLILQALSLLSVQ